MKKEIIKSQALGIISTVILYLIFYLWFDNFLISLIFSVIIAKSEEYILLKKGLWSAGITLSYSITGCIILGNILRIFISDFNYTAYFGTYIIEFVILLYLQYRYFKALDNIKNYDIDTIDCLTLQMLCGGDFKGAYLWALALIALKSVMMLLQYAAFNFHHFYLYWLSNIFICGITAAHCRSFIISFEKEKKYQHNILFLYFFVNSVFAKHFLVWDYFLLSILFHAPVLVEWKYRLLKLIYCTRQRHHPNKKSRTIPSGFKYMQMTMNNCKLLQTTM